MRCSLCRSAQHIRCLRVRDEERWRTWAPRALRWRCGGKLDVRTWSSMALSIRPCVLVGCHAPARRCRRAAGSRDRIKSSWPPGETGAPGGSPPGAIQRGGTNQVTMELVKTGNQNNLENKPAKLKPTDPGVVPWSERCAACGHSRAHHIGIDGPCNVLENGDFCKCDRFAPARPAPTALPPAE